MILNPLLAIIKQNHQHKQINGYNYFTSDTYISVLAYKIILCKSSRVFLQNENTFWHTIVAIYDKLPNCDKLLNKYISDTDMIEKLYSYIVQRIEHCEAWDTLGAWKLLNVLINADNEGKYHKFLDQLVLSVLNNVNKLHFASVSSDQLLQLIANNERV